MLLLSGSDDDNLFQWPEEEVIPPLDRLAELLLDTTWASNTSLR